MTTPESEFQMIGQVRWRPKNSEYGGGLEELEPKIIGTMWIDGVDYSSVGWFVREVAIATIRPQACQWDPRKYAQELINRGLLTEGERDYVYGRFGFDPDNFKPPDWMK